MFMGNGKDESEHYFLAGEKLLIVKNKQDTVVGSGGIVRLNDTDAELKRMWILPHYRCRGIGKEVLEKLIEFARKQGYKSLLLEIWMPNKQQAAFTFYSKHGFYKVPHYHKGERMGIAMQKDL